MKKATRPVRVVGLAVWGRHRSRTDRDLDDDLLWWAEPGRAPLGLGTLTVDRGALTLSVGIPGLLERTAISMDRSECTRICFGPSALGFARMFPLSSETDLTPLPDQGVQILHRRGLDTIAHDLVELGWEVRRLD